MSGRGNVVQGAGDNEVLEEWFSLVQKWEAAEQDLKQAKACAEAALPETSGNVVEAQRHLANLKRQMNAVIKRGRDARDPDAENFVMGSLKLGRPC